MSNVDLTPLQSLSPEDLAVVKELGKNQGTVDPRQAPGRPQVWKVGSRNYLAYFIPGTQTPIVWEASQDQLQAFYGDNVPAPDRTLTDSQFKAMSPWKAGLAAELRNTADDPWTQFFSDFNEAAELRPWLKEPDMLAVMATAYLEGRTPTTDELSKTDWWNTHKADERKWLEESVTMGKREMEGRRNEARQEVMEQLRQAGVREPDERIAQYIASRRLTGQWSETYTALQIRKLSDPHAEGQLDPNITAQMEKHGIWTIDTMREGEQQVEQLMTTWLGPTMGGFDKGRIADWAGRLRNDPDAEQDLVSMLKRQRVALLPSYTDENLTYEDIIQPVRNLASNVWGQPVQDEAMLLDLANTGDYTEMQKRLRKRGLNQGVQKVVGDALESIGSTPMGEQVVQSAI